MPVTKISDAAALLGKRGGKKGGPARAATLSADERRNIATSGGRARQNSMTPEQRSEAARNAAKARWDKKKKIS
jgi:hypothetical protein